MKILLIDNYDSFTYNLYHYLTSLKCKVEVYRNDKIKIKKLKKIIIKKLLYLQVLVIQTKLVLVLNIVKKFYKTIPILGVCLGHQVIGQAFKSKIIEAKKLMHGKTSLIKHNKKGIFKGIKKIINATRYHSLIIDRKTIGKDLIITAETFDKIIMGIMHKKYNVHGVQFHPESLKTPEGMKLLKNFLKNINNGKCF